MKNKFQLNADGMTFLFNNGLTPGEINIVRQIYDCKTNKEIAVNLFVTEKTVKFHLTHIYKKLKVINRFALIVLMAKYFEEAREEKKLKRAAKQKRRTSRAR